MSRDPNRVFVFSAEHRRKIGQSRMAEKNPMWRGDNVGRYALHIWVRKRLSEPKLCQECGKCPPVDLANKGVYDRNLDNWEYLCRKCHLTKDGRLDRLHNRSYATNWRWPKGVPRSKATKRKQSISMRANPHYYTVEERRRRSDAKKEWWSRQK